MVCKCFNVYTDVQSLMVRTVELRPCVWYVVRSCVLRVTAVRQN